MQVYEKLVLKDYKGKIVIFFVALKNTDKQRPGTDTIRTTSVYIVNAQQYNSRGRNFTRGDHSKNIYKIRVCYFSKRNPYMKFQDDISFRNIIVAKFQGPKF